MTTGGVGIAGPTAISYPKIDCHFHFPAEDFQPPIHDVVAAAPNLQLLPTVLLLPMLNVGYNQTVPMGECGK
jgi:hypothetical protein